MSITLTTKVRTLVYSKIPQMLIVPRYWQEALRFAHDADLLQKKKKEQGFSVCAVSAQTIDLLINLVFWKYL
jgi:hypothetical protein